MKIASSGIRRALHWIAATAAAAALGLGMTHASAADLQNIEDQLQIQHLWAEYAYALDTLDADAYAALFAPDAVIEMADGMYKGRDKIHGLIDRYRKGGALDSIPADTHGRKFGPVRHVTTSLKLEVKGNTATAESYWMEVNSNGKNAQGKVNPPSVLNMGRYEDELVKQNGKWLFSKRHIIGDMGIPTPASITQPNRE